MKCSEWEESAISGFHFVNFTGWHKQTGCEQQEPVCRSALTTECHVFMLAWENSSSTGVQYIKPSSFLIGDRRAYYLDSQYMLLHRKEYNLGTLAGV